MSIVQSGDLVHMGTSDLAFFKKIENHISEFQRILKINQDVASDPFHKLAKYQFQILRVLTYTKMT